MTAGRAVLAGLCATLLGVLLLPSALPAAGPQPAGDAAPALLPVLGVDALAEGTVVERRADALSHWAQRGITGALLLHVDAHDGLQGLDDGRIAALRELRDRGDAEAFARAGRGGAEALFNGRNFVRAAAALGIVREVVWVVPFELPGAGGVSESLRADLERAGFPAADVATFRPEGGCYRGRVGALPVSICGQERLPGIGEPVLLSLGASFLLQAANYRGLSPLIEIRALAAALREARYRVRDAVVAHSVLETEVPVELRWVGEALVQLLREPALGLRARPPERWAALQRLSTLRAAGRTDEVLEVSHSLLERQPHDAALLLFAAESMAGHGSVDSALAYAREACRSDRGYCAGLREIGLQLLEGGAPDDAARLFAAAEQALPGGGYGQLDEGLLLARVGKPVEAVAAFERLIAREGAFPGAFLVGAVHASSGNREAARRAFDAGRAALAAPHAPVGREEVAAAIRQAAGFYRTEGLVAEALRLEGDPRLRLAPAAGGP